MRPGEPEYGRRVRGDTDPIIRDFGNADRVYLGTQWDDDDTAPLRPPPPARHARPAVDTSWVTTTADRVEPDRRTRPWEFLVVCAIALLITLAAGGCITVAVMRWLGMEI